MNYIDIIHYILVRAMRLMANERQDYENSVIVIIFLRVVDRVYLKPLVSPSAVST